MLRFQIHEHYFLFLHMIPKIWWVLFKMANDFMKFHLLFTKNHATVRSYALIKLGFQDQKCDPSWDLVRWIKYISLSFVNKCERSPMNRSIENSHWKDESIAIEILRFIDINYIIRILNIVFNAFYINDIDFIV